MKESIDTATDRDGSEVFRGDLVRLCTPHDAGHARQVCGIHQSETGRVTVLLTCGLSVKSSDVLLTVAE